MSLADDFKNIDPNNPGQWPLVVQLVVFVVVFVLILAAGWKFDWSGQREQVDSLHKRRISKV